MRLNKFDIPIFIMHSKLMQRLFQKKIKDVARSFYYPSYAYFLRNCRERFGNCVENFNLGNVIKALTVLIV
jgi:hypothetical protein